MERISRDDLLTVQTQLASALAIPNELSRRRLSDSEDQHLQTLLGQMAERYPHQDLSASAEGYLWDYQQLALKYSLAEVQAALAEWRITAGATFFPRPDEMASSIELRRQSENENRARRQRAAQRKREIDEFWKEASGWMERTGFDEEELLKRFPSFRGTKPDA
jgi:hypothetical protein